MAEAGVVGIGATLNGISFPAGGREQVFMADLPWQKQATGSEQGFVFDCLHIAHTRRSCSE